MEHQCNHGSAKLEIYRSIEICSSCRQNEQDWLMSDYYYVFMTVYGDFGCYGAELIASIANETAIIKGTSMEEEICFFLASYLVANSVSLDEVRIQMLQQCDPIFYLPAEIRTLAYSKTPCPVHIDEPSVALPGVRVICIGCLLNERNCVGRTLRSNREKNARPPVLLRPEELVVYHQVLELTGLPDHYYLQLALMRIARGLTYKTVFHTGSGN